jgi:cell division protein FtsN
MYETGNAVPKDMSKATELYIAAARSGLKDAKERLASIGVSEPQSLSKTSSVAATTPPPPPITEIPSNPAATMAAATAPASPAVQSQSKPPAVVATALPPPVIVHQVASAPIGEKPEAGEYSLQLGSFKTVASAEAAWTEARQTQLLASSSHQVKQVELGDKGTWYRLLVVGFKDHSAAASLCDRLKATGGLCLVVRSDA